MNRPRAARQVDSGATTGVLHRGIVDDPGTSRAVPGPSADQAEAGCHGGQIDLGEPGVVGRPRSCPVRRMSRVWLPSRCRRRSSRDRRTRQRRDALHSATPQSPRPCRHAPSRRCRGTGGRRQEFTLDVQCGHGGQSVIVTGRVPVRSRLISRIAGRVRHRHGAVRHRPRASQDESVLATLSNVVVSIMLESPDACMRRKGGVGVRLVPVLMAGVTGWWRNSVMCSNAAKAEGGLLGLSQPDPGGVPGGILPAEMSCRLTRNGGRVVPMLRTYGGGRGSSRGSRELPPSRCCS